MKNLGDFKPYEVMYIDAMNLSIRNYYGMSDLEYHGHKTGMLYGVARLFIEWLKRAPGIEIVMLWEGRDSWRKAKYPIYKAYRGEERSPAETKEFFDCIERVKYALPVMGIKQAWCPTFEADDVVANLVMSESRKALLSSGDWDWWELAEYGDILYQHKDILTIDEMGTRFTKKYNAPMVPIDKLWLFKVLCGDESDKVSGIPRFPKKLASKLCNMKDISAGFIIQGLICLKAIKWAERVKANMWIINRNIELLHSSYIPLNDVEWVDGDYSVEKFGDVLLKSGMENLYDRFVGSIK
jgi:5'-3' exonuclease